MATYKLTITIAAADLAIIAQAGESIGVVLAMASNVGTAQALGAAPIIVWQAITPFESNQLQWSDNAPLLFVATAAPAAETVVVMQGSAAAWSGGYLAFADGQFTTGPAQALPAGSYGLANRQGSALSFGLALPAQVNGAALPASPASVRFVPNQQFAQFTPLASVQVFLRTQLQNGLVIATTLSTIPALPLPAGGGELLLSYDAASGQFQNKGS